MTTVVGPVSGPDRPDHLLPQAALEAVPAGFPSPAQGYYSGPVDLNRHLMRDPTATFLVRVSGDSMTGAGIFDGDELVVDRGVHAFTQQGRPPVITLVVRDVKPSGLNL